MACSEEKLLSPEKVREYMKYLEKLAAPVAELPEDELQNSTRGS